MTREYQFDPDEPSGTMPHALMLSFGKGNQEEAWSAFNEGVADTVPRIALCDTYTDEDFPCPPRLAVMLNLDPSKCLF